MAQAKFKKVFEDMWTDHKSELEQFMVTHAKFSVDPKSNRAEFNKQGDKIIAIIRHYESILCGRSEGAGFGNYTSKLAEKFWGEVRKVFPEIDEVGVE